MVKGSTTMCGVLKLTAESFEKIWVTLCIHNYRNVKGMEIGGKATGMIDTEDTGDTWGSSFQIVGGRRIVDLKLKWNTEKFGSGKRQGTIETRQVFFFKRNYVHVGRQRGKGWDIGQ